MVDKVADKTEEKVETPTEEQVKQANEAELKKWEGDFDPEDLKIPYSRDEVKDGKKDTTEEDKEEPKEKETAEIEEAETTEEYAEPEPVITVEDPGEYVPQDYSFSIDIKGKTYKVESLEQAENLAEEHAEDLNAKQLFSLVSKGSKIDIKQERDKEKWEADKKKFEEQSQEATQRQETIETLASEFKYLEDKGLVPKVADEYRDADWTNPEVAKQPGVKEQIALLNYMTKENEKRAKAGVKPMTSILDVHNAWLLDQERKDQKKADKEAGEARKAAGARVAGVSPSQVGTTVPKGISVGNPNVFKRNQAIWDN